MKQIKLITLLLICSNIVFGQFKKYERFTVNNRNNLALLETGMTKTEVVTIMGDRSISSFGGAFVGNPYKTELFKTTQGNSISVFWYYTQILTTNGVVDPDELTPVVFINGKMQGFGWSFYRETHKHIDITIRNIENK